MKIKLLVIIAAALMFISSLWTSEFEGEAEVLHWWTSGGKANECQYT